MDCLEIKKIEKIKSYFLMLEKMGYMETRRQRIDKEEMEVNLFYIS